MYKITTLYKCNWAILGYMNKIVALPAPKPRSVAARNTAWTYAAILTVMAVGQLFAFEKFIPLLKKYDLVGGDGTATLLACLIVIVEIMALPFLLRMRLSRLMRWVSLCCGVIAPAVWVKLSLFAIITSTELSNGGILGSKVSVGLVPQLVLGLVLLVVAAYVAHGLWPTAKK